MRTQPPRAPADGPIDVRRTVDDGISIQVVHRGEQKTLVMTSFNAFRVFAALALLLEVPLPRAAQKGIVMG